MQAAVGAQQHRPDERSRALEREVSGVAMVEHERGPGTAVVEPRRAGDARRRKPIQATAVAEVQAQRCRCQGSGSDRLDEADATASAAARRCAGDRRPRDPSVLRQVEACVLIDDVGVGGVVRRASERMHVAHAGGSRRRRGPRDSGVGRAPDPGPERPSHTRLPESATTELTPPDGNGRDVVHVAPLSALMDRP